MPFYKHFTLKDVKCAAHSQNLLSCNSNFLDTLCSLHPQPLRFSSAHMKKISSVFENILSLLLSAISIILTFQRIICFIILCDMQEVCKLCTFHRDPGVNQHLQLYEKSLTGTYLPVLAVTDTPEHEPMSRLSLFSKHEKSKIK